MRFKERILGINIDSLRKQLTGMKKKPKDYVIRSIWYNFEKVENAKTSIDKHWSRYIWVIKGYPLVCQNKLGLWNLMNKIIRRYK